MCDKTLIPALYNLRSDLSEFYDALDVCRQTQVLPCSVMYRLAEIEGRLSDIINNTTCDHARV